MTDKELLIYAAKAIGYRVRNLAGRDVYVLTEGQLDNDLPTVKWNPLTDDGDALRLAVKLNLLVDCDEVTQEADAVLAMRGYESDYFRCTEPYGQDKYAATRRAIVRAAAEIGKDKQ